MMKTHGMQTVTAVEGAASAEGDLAAALRGAQCAVAALAAQIAVLVEAEERQRTEHAEERARLQARCDALAAERDRAVEAADRAEARIGELRAHIEERLEQDRAMLASIDVEQTGSGAMETTRPRRARKARTLLAGEGAPGGAGSAGPCAAATDPVGSEPTPEKWVAVPTGKDREGVAAEPAREHGPERAPEDADRVEDAVMVTVAVPRRLYTALERAVAEGSFRTIGAALLSRCGIGMPGSCLRPPPGRPDDAEARTARHGPAAEADGAVIPGG